MNGNTPSLDNAPQHIQLAVDLLYLLETNGIDIDVALKALKIVELDLLHQLDKQANKEIVEK
jgi:hypothetical protein